MPHLKTRIVSVAGIRLDSWKSVRPFKGIICDDISEFESYMPSHAVRSLWAKRRASFRHFEPEKEFRLATYAMWWIKAAIQEYILRSWSLVKMGTTANQKKLFFNLRKAKSKISVLDEGDLRPDQVKLIARRLGVTEQDVVDMNRRLAGDVSLDAPIREDGNSGEWQNWLVDEHPDQETTLAASEEFGGRRKALVSALSVLNNRERRIFEARRLVEEPITLKELADEFGVSRERVRQIGVCAFEKVQKSVKNRVALMETPAPRPAH